MNSSKVVLFFFFNYWHCYRCPLFPSFNLMSSLSPPPPFWPSPNCYLCTWAMHIYTYVLWQISRPLTRSPLTASSVFHVSMSLFILFVILLCSLDSHMWVRSHGIYCSLTGLFSIIISTPIHAVKKGKIAFFFIAV